MHQDTIWKRSLFVGNDFVLEKIYEFVNFETIEKTSLMF